MAKLHETNLGALILSKGKAVFAVIYTARSLIIVALLLVYFLLFLWSVNKHQKETGRVLLDKGQCIQVIEPLEVEMRM